MDRTGEKAHGDHRVSRHGGSRVGGVWFSIVFMLACVGAQGLPYQSILLAEKETAFLAHFDGTLAVEVPETGASPGGAFDFPRGKFGKGIRFPACSKEIVSFPVKSAWVNGEGTASFWVRLDWAPKENVTNGRTIVDLFTRKENANRLRVYFYSNGEKSPGTFLFLVLSDAAGKAFTHGVDLGNDAKWRAGEWHHVAVSWKSGKGIVFAIDGAAQKLGKAGETWEADLSGAELFVGMPYYTASHQGQGRSVARLEGTLDELMLSRKALLAFP